MNQHDGGPAPGGHRPDDADHELAAGVEPCHVRPLRICTKPNSQGSTTIWTFTSQWLDSQQTFAILHPVHFGTASKCNHVLDVMFLCFARVTTRQGRVSRLAASLEARALDLRRTAFHGASCDAPCWRLPADRRRRDATGPVDETAQRSSIIQETVSRRRLRVPSGLFEEALSAARLEQVITERFGKKQPLPSLSALKTDA